MLTTTSGALPSRLFNKLCKKPEKVKEIVSRIEVQHGNILEHNKCIWKLEAQPEQVMKIMLRTKFFNFTQINDNKWLMSGNMRAIIEYADHYKDEFSCALVDSISTIAPVVYGFIMRRLK
jgi:hypothetical protein